MKTPSALKLLLGSAAVYALVATAHGCSDATPLPFGTGGSTSASATASATASSTITTAGHTSGSIMNPVPDAEAESGSRLRAKWTTGDDGSRSFAGFWDSLRKEDCIWRTLADGKIHCSPSSFNAFGGDGFADPLCTQLVDAVPTCSGIKYASKIEQSCPLGFGQLVHLYALGPQLATVYDVNGPNNTCVPSAMQPGYEYHAILTTEVDPSVFVSATVVTE